MKVTLVSLKDIFVSLIDYKRLHIISPNMYLHLYCFNYLVHNLVFKGKYNGNCGYWNNCKTHGKRHNRKSFGRKRNTW